MGNGAKAAQKRERNGAVSAKGGGKSQLKSNEASKNIVCQTCRQPFMSTTRAPALEDHAKSKHGKDMAECFPTASK